eukprot:CAMPEP_0117524326 /NCGR_PEP_ID=MMETSP0784-20121206/35188_1 /TAXON_ID=39447 /ORGANISM="" /LENGTH=597 /DNA_ID=CAMNT_0005320471 /DNA_START=77 /DNA_END=1867 /DNA_ORIENTATION=-
MALLAILCVTLLALCYESGAQGTTACKSAEPEGLALVQTSTRHWSAVIASDAEAHQGDVHAKGHARPRRLRTNRTDEDSSAPALALEQLRPSMLAGAAQLVEVIGSVVYRNNASASPVYRFNPLQLWSGKEDCHGLALPMAERQGQSCAVVGSSGAILGASYGAEIDAHDFVIRFNAAPTQGYEDHVGSRTDLRMLNCPTLGVLSAEGQTALFEGDQARTRYLSCKDPPASAIWRATRWDDGFREQCIYPVLDPHPEEVTFGFEGVMRALAGCSRVSVFGFAVPPQQEGDEAEERFPYHYFQDMFEDDFQKTLDASWNFYEAHDFELEESYLKSWNRTSAKVVELLDSFRERFRDNSSLFFEFGSTTVKNKGSCALVGSSPELLAREAGHDIDDKDATFRSNCAPSRGYELHVGSNTTVRVMSPSENPKSCLPAGEQVESIIKDTDPPYIKEPLSFEDWQKEVPDVASARSAAYGTDLAVEFCNLLFYVAEHQHLEETHLDEVIGLFLDLHIGNSSEYNWMQIPMASNSPHHCSTGAVTATWSLLMCDHVHAYGYTGCPGAAASPSSLVDAAGKEHYYDAQGSEHAHVADTRYQVGQ